MLRLDQISHPHTAERIKTCVDQCTEDWGIPKHKILTVITHNGSNMVAALKIMNVMSPAALRKNPRRVMKTLRLSKTKGKFFQFVAVNIFGSRLDYVNVIELCLAIFSFSIKVLC